MRVISLSELKEQQTSRNESSEMIVSNVDDGAPEDTNFSIPKYR